MNMYNYLFYRIYKRHNTKYSKHESAFFATMVQSCIIFLNLFTIGIYLSRNKIITYFLNSKVQAIILISFVMIFNFLYFFNKKKYLKIESRYSSVNKKTNNLGAFLIILYIIVTLFFFFVMINYKR